jgi:hypothetical protein
MEQERGATAVRASGAESVNLSMQYTPKCIMTNNFQQKRQQKQFCAITF